MSEIPEGDQPEPSEQRPHLPAHPSAPLAPQGYGQQFYGQQGYPAQPYAVPMVPYVQVASPPTSGTGVTSMILGIVSLFLCCFGWVTGVMAIVFAAVSMKSISESNGRIGGRGMAITGLVLGIITTVVYLPWMVLWLLGSASAPFAG